MAMMAVQALTGVPLSDDLQQVTCRILAGGVQADGGRSLRFHVQQLQAALGADGHKSEAAGTSSVDVRLLPGEATKRTTVIFPHCWTLLIHTLISDILELYLCKDSLYFSFQYLSNLHYD